MGKPAPKRWSQWIKDPAIRFVGLFVVCLALGQFFYYQVVVDSSAFAAYTEGSCRLAAKLLHLTGESVQVSGDQMTGSFSMSVHNGCDGLQAVGILIFAILLFPGPIGRRVLGAALGALLIVAINVVRIASLYWAGVHKPDWFQMMHVHLWPAFLIFCVLVFWVAWEMGSTAPRPARS